MRYEPVSYIYEYEIGAFVIFLAIFVRYFLARRFPSQKSRMYTMIMCATVLDIVLDVCSSLIIQYVFMMPLAVTFIVNSTFYGISIIMLVFMMLYAMALVGYIGKDRMKKTFPSLIPAVFVLLLLISNPFTKLFFFVDPVKGYVHGSLFILIYVTCFIYMIFTAVITLRNRASLQHQEFATIMTFLVVVLVATIAQYFIPSFLITGVAIMFAVGLMYFTLQNPDSMVDIATGAFTFEAMLSYIQNRMFEGKHLKIVSIKIQNMTRINELLGIENGSMLLKSVCGYMRESSNNVFVFRMRGSCFVAITHNKKDYQMLRDKMHNEVSRAWKLGNTELLLQATVCCFESDELFDEPISAETAVKLLETAILKKNESGERIKVISVDDELIRKNKRRQAVESALREAIVSGEGLELYFQPLWSVDKKRFVSAEVLLRFNHSELGKVSPNEFVEIAESSGFVTELDEWVVRKACELIEKNRFSEIGIERLEINLSALEFMHQRLPELLSDIMKHYSVNSSFLCFEITETAATESFDVLLDCMKKICDFGCTFALDDFGTGYANIAKVLCLPFSMIKLDKSLLYHPDEIIADLSRMFSRMSRLVVVEGVETVDQSDLCCSCNVHYIQGFYYAKPMNCQDFIDFMLKQNQN